MMSRLAVPCDVIPTGDTILKGKDKRGNDIEIKISDLNKQPEVDICSTIESCPKIRNLDAKDAQLQSQLNTLNEKIEKTNPLTNNPNDKGIKQRLDEAEACCEELHEKLDDNEKILREVNDNISILKSWNTRQDEKIEGIKREAVVDTEYNNFEEWVENVYLPNADALVNKRSIGDMYINLTQGLGSQNSFYINIRRPDATTPPSANDWVMVPNNGMQDLISILGIDPIKVDRPGKHTWTVSIDPNKLGDMISELPRLDLTKVDVSLGEIHFDPVFKEDATIEENLNVGNTTTTKDLHVKDTAIIEKACIKEMICDTEFKGRPAFNDVQINGTTNLKTINQTGGNVTLNGPHVSITGTSVVIPRIEGDTHFTDVINAPDINIENKSVTENLTVKNETILNGHVTINGPFQFINDKDPDQKPVCLDNMTKNLFRPSYGMFKLAGTGFITDNNNPKTGEIPAHSTTTFGLGTDSIQVFNQAQPTPSGYIWVNSPGNSTQIIWENADYATPSVFLGPQGITIDGTGEDAGIYRIDYGCTIQMRDVNAPSSNELRDDTPADNNQQVNNWESIRSGVAIYTKENISQGGYIVDDKYHRTIDKWMFTHDHEYYDSDSYGSSRTRRTSKVAQRHPLRTDNEMNGYNYHFSKAAEWYTFTRSMLVKIDGLAIVAPYLKVSSNQEGAPCVGSFFIADGKWNTGSNSQITIQKIANLGAPYEYHC